MDEEAIVCKDFYNIHSPDNAFIHPYIHSFKPARFVDKEAIVC